MSQPIEDASLASKDETHSQKGKERPLHAEPGEINANGSPEAMPKPQPTEQDTPGHELGHDVEAAGPSNHTNAVDQSQEWQPSHTHQENTSQGVHNLQLSPAPPPLAAATKELPATPPPPPPPAQKRDLYFDPTPDTPQISRAPSRRLATSEDYNEKDVSYGPGSANEEKQVLDTSEATDQGAQSEIQNIMDQFDDEMGAPRQDEIMSPRLELASPLLGVAGQFPPRKSSLEPLRPVESFAGPAVAAELEQDPSSPPPVPPKPSLASIRSPPAQASTPSSPTLSRQPPPPEPEPDQPFDFHRFLEQLRHKSADPVAKFLRSFLTEFGKKQWMVHEQVKIIGDFLSFISNKMALCEVWRDVSDTEFDNAKEGMEKLVMNRLYAQTFSPAIPPPSQPPRGKSRRKETDKSLGPGRQGQHQEDVERDDILAQKVRIYGWVKEEHLDIAPVGSNGERFLKLAQQELLKIKGYRAPRDKVICILNCCKVIFGLLKNAKSADTSADSFVPLLIYVVLQANPEHLVSNIQYILRFRNQDKLGGEAGYYLSSLSGAIQFVESLDRTSLTISDDEFERNVELAVSAIAERNREAEMANSPAQYVSEKSKLSEPEITPRNSMDATYSSPGKKARNETSMATSNADTEENAAVAGLLRTIQRPLSTIGRIFSDESSTQGNRGGPASTPQPGSTPRLSPSVFQPPRDSGELQRPEDGVRPQSVGDRSSQLVQSYDAQEAAARQASAEAAEARRIQRAEHRNVVETMYGMFPNLDKDLIDDVVRQKEGRVGLAVDACLALSTGG